MSETREALSEALSGKVNDVPGDVEEMEVDQEIDWEALNGVEDFNPEDQTFQKRRGRKPEKLDREKLSHEYEHTADDQAVIDSIGAPLHNAAPPELRIQQEKTDHRFLVYLFAQGKSVKDVFLALGGKWDDENGKAFPVKSHGGKYSYAHLTQIRRQPWFQKEVLNLMKQEGGDVVQAAFANEFENSLQTIIEIRDDSEEKGSTRLAAANTIMDRFLGKPTQHVKSETTHRTIAEIAKDKDKLDEELEVIEAEIVSMSPEPVREITNTENTNE